MDFVPHLVQYQGSKRNLAFEISKHFPGHFSRLVEPFSGTGAVSIYAAAKGLCPRYHLNDINKPIIDMMKLCVDDPELLTKEYEIIWSKQFLPGKDNVDYYYEMRDLFNNSDSNPGLTLFILARVAKGAIRYNSKGRMNQICDKRRFGTRPETIYKNAKAISQLLRGSVTFSTLDYKEILDSAEPDDLVYMDPPYQGVARGLSSRYLQNINHDEFVHEIYKLNEKNSMFIISYDGKTGDKVFGNQLPDDLDLHHILIDAGRSSQATLNGRSERTYESLYISRRLMEQIIE